MQQGRRWLALRQTHLQRSPQEHRRSTPPPEIRRRGAQTRAAGIGARLSRRGFRRQTRPAAPGATRRYGTDHRLDRADLERIGRRRRRGQDRVRPQCSGRDRGGPGRRQRPRNVPTGSCRRLRSSRRIVEADGKALQGGSRAPRPRRARAVSGRWVGGSASMAHRGRGPRQSVATPRSRRGNDCRPALPRRGVRSQAHRRANRHPRPDRRLPQRAGGVERREADREVDGRFRALLADEQCARDL